MSHFENPLPDPSLPPVEAALSYPLPEPQRENPPWSGWEVLQIAGVTLVMIVVFVLATTFVTQRLLYPKTSIMDVAKIPLVSVVAQLLAYLIILGYMAVIAGRRTGGSLWHEVRWFWPKAWGVYLFGGIVMAFSLQGIAHFLPMPRELPIDKFFQTPMEAWVLSLFGVTLAPLMEELFFRGFLYPVLARRVGLVLAILFTAAGFGLIHAPQLGRAWGPVVVVFLVGLVLTIVRAVTRSVAPGFLMHMAYNATLSSLLFVASGGFRHLDKLGQ
ncbi:MAG: CPBP family intramembrane metalloprotease [Acidobacteriales bacterium]|nr:CPBP family intramembrane metalloprotease [Terriglobales bacterium]